MVLVGGTTYPGDLVCMAVGIRPEVRLANDAHLDVGRGVTVDDQMMTSDPAIFATGECVKHSKQLFSLVAPLYNQANVLAGTATAFQLVQTATNLKVTGVDLFSAGNFAEGPGRGIRKRLVIECDRLLGAVMYCDTADIAWLFSQIKDGSDIAQLQDTLIFGPAFQAVPNRTLWLPLQHCRLMRKSVVVAAFAKVSS